MDERASRRLAGLLEELEHFGLKLGLERMRALLAELGSPESELPVALVAGTNGKGSTSAWLAAVVSAAGYRSGLFTSPHLERVEERLRLDGRAVPTDRLLALVERVLEASRRGGTETVTYFEALTAAAIEHFRRERVDLAVMEVGLGGRLDATNVTRPLVSLITSISFDHQKQLGSTLAEIAREKAGILRSGGVGLAASAPDEVRRALLEAAEDLGGRIDFVDELVRVVSVESDSAAGQRLELETGSSTYRLTTPLGGAHQRENLKLAVAGAESLASLGFAAIDREAIERGIAACSWPGRLEPIELPGGRRVVLDGAHNPAGLEALTDALGGLERPWTLVFGMLREKVDAAVVAELWSRAQRVLVTAPDSPRALPPTALARLVGGAPGEPVDGVGAALERALEESDLVVVAGSLYLVGEARAWLRAVHGRPAPSDRLFDFGRGSGA